MIGGKVIDPIDLSYFLIGPKFDTQCNINFTVFRVITKMAWVDQNGCKVGQCDTISRAQVCTRTYEGGKNNELGHKMRLFVTIICKNKKKYYIIVCLCNTVTGTQILIN